MHPKINTNSVIHAFMYKRLPYLTKLQPSKLLLDTGDWEEEEHHEYYVYHVSINYHILVKAQCAQQDSFGEK